MMVEMFDWTCKHEKQLSTVLLVVALVTFIASVGLFLSGQILPFNFLPERLVPSSLLATIMPALSVLLVYELLLLTLAVREPFVVFVRREFEIISLIVLRDLFKKLEELSVSDDNRLLLELTVVAIGSIVLYFFVEVLERIQRNFIKGELKEDLPDKVPWLKEPKRWLELALLVFFAGLVVYETIGLVVGIPGAGYDRLFLTLVFSGLIVFSVVQLFMTLLATSSYEVLFEHSALVLASVVVLIALPKDSLTGVPMIIAALLFVIATLLLHGFARGQALIGVWRQLK